MDSTLREQFFGVTMRLKRLDFCASSSCCLQQSELAVMTRVSSCCTGNTKPVCVSSIHETMHISKPAVSQTLNSLEQKGFILRTIDPLDRRKITVTLTLSGQGALTGAKKSFDANIDSLLDKFGEDNVKSLVSLINQLMDIIEKN